MTTKNKQRTGIEWVGGLVSMPTYVTGEGEPYRPEALFWMSASGAVLPRGHRGVVERRSVQACADIGPRAGRFTREEERPQACQQNPEEEPLTPRLTGRTTSS